MYRMRRAQITLKSPKQGAACDRQRVQYALAIFDAASDDNQISVQSVGESSLECRFVAVVVVRRQNQWPPEAGESLGLPGNFRIRDRSEGITHGLLECARLARLEHADNVVCSADEFVAWRRRIERRRFTRYESFQARDEGPPVAACLQAHSRTDKGHEPASFISGHKFRQSSFKLGHQDFFLDLFSRVATSRGWPG